jgi:hypothetical protein
MVKEIGLKVEVAARQAAPFPRRHEMRFYYHQRQFYAGIDLDTRNRFTQILDQQGKTVSEQDLPGYPDASDMPSVNPSQGIRRFGRGVTPEPTRCRAPTRAVARTPYA